MHGVPLVFKHAIAQGHLHWKQQSDAGGVTALPGYSCWDQGHLLCPPGDEAHGGAQDLKQDRAGGFPSEDRISNLEESVLLYFFFEELESETGVPHVGQQPENGVSLISLFKTVTLG